MIIPLARPLARLPLWLWALTAGALAALAHPPFGFIVGVLAYGAVMRLAEDAPSWRSAFRRGWLAGLAYFAIGFWWVTEAFLVDAATFGWMAPLAIAALAAGMALFWGAAMAVYRLLAPAGPWRVLVFAGVLSAFEFLRGHILTGLPWNLPGTSWAAGGAVSQSASLVGSYGLTWLTLAIAAAPTTLFDQKRRQGMAATFVAGLVLAALFAYGQGRLGTPPDLAGQPRVRIVQANIPQVAKYDQALFNSIVSRYLAMTAQKTAEKAGGRPDIVVWPEGAIPQSFNDYLAPDAALRTAIMGALTPGQILIIGGYRAEGTPAAPAYYNSLIALWRGQEEMRTISVYDKYRLVPFGEFLPLEKLLSPLGIKKLVPLDSFTPGPPPAPVSLGPFLVQPLICYEALFPGLTGSGARHGGHRAQAIVNISNDAWFGMTSGPLQHLNQAAYRAIEEGLPMIRSTPTGVSAMIDAHGRILARQGLGQRGLVEAILPKAAPPTPYGRTGEAGFLVMIAISALIWGPIRRKAVTVPSNRNNDRAQEGASL